MVDALDAGMRWPRGRHLLPIFTVAALGLNVAVVAWFAVSSWEERLAKAAFTNIAGDYAEVLQNGLDQYLGKMTVLRAFYDSSVEVDPDEFESFTGQILHGKTSIMRLTWSPYVARGERDAFVRKARQRGLQHYEIKDWTSEGNLPAAPERADYFPVLYATADPNLRPLLGLDLDSEPARREALERARDGDRIATVADVRLREVAGGDRRGFFAALPIYRRGMPKQTVEDRRRNTLGVLGGTLQTVAVVDQILATAKHLGDVDLYLFAADAGAEGAPEFTRAFPRKTEPLQPKPQAALASLPHWLGEIKAGDARWALIMTPTEGRLTSYHRTWTVLGFVVLVFGAVLAHMWASARYALRLEAANSKVLELAKTDILTSLANRRAFITRLTEAFTASRRGAPGFAVLYIDIDDFKDVNDTLGHPMGDTLLQEIVGRLKQAVREEDLVARFGGDEFAILQTGVTDPAAVNALATRVAELTAMPFNIGGHLVRITASTGISLFSPELSGPEANPPIVAVNVSGVQIKGGSELVRAVEEALARWDVDPGGIELGLTETVLMEAAQKHSATLRQLRQLGTKIAIDDFGTGYSSLKYLTAYPLNRLKLAQELVFGVTGDRRSAAMVQAAISLAGELDIDVIAGGVETAAQAKFLIGAGCQQAQGFFYSRPVDADSAADLLRQGKIRPAKASVGVLRPTAA